MSNTAVHSIQKHNLSVELYPRNTIQIMVPIMTNDEIHSLIEIRRGELWKEVNNIWFENYEKNYSSCSIWDDLGHAADELQEYIDELLRARTTAMAT